MEFNFNGGGRFTWKQVAAAAAVIVALIGKLHGIGF